MKKYSWFDAHLDLAYLALRGRNMNLSPEEAGGPHQPGAVTIPSLKEGGFRYVLATIFTETGGADEVGYPVGDVEAAYQRGIEQLNWYHDHLGEDRPFYSLKTVLEGDRNQDKIALGILMENADPIRDPQELSWWRDQGVVAVGMAWWKSSRYAGGNGTDEGLTDLGRALVERIDQLGLVHDLSHLSQRSTDELLSLTSRPVMASHSNCRRLLGGEKDGKNQRHLNDDTISEIGRRGGVIGLNLCRNFIRDGLDKESGERPSVDEAVDHVEHICQIMGHKKGVGLGSDMDGGFTNKDMCEGIESPRDLTLLVDKLTERGWADDEIDGFVQGNWLRFLRQNLRRR